MLHIFFDQLSGWKCEHFNKRPWNILYLIQKIRWHLLHLTTFLHFLLITDGLLIKDCIFCFASNLSCDKSCPWHKWRAAFSFLWITRHSVSNNRFFFHPQNVSVLQHIPFLYFFIDSDLHVHLGIFKYQSTVCFKVHQ